MNSAILHTHSAVALILVKWTALLMLGWTVHGLAYRRHARLRLILWRSMLGFGLVLPLTSLFPFAVLKIPIQSFPTQPAVSADLVPTSTTSSPVQRAALVAQPPQPAAEEPELRNVSYSPVRQVRPPVSWSNVLLAGWAAGFFWGAFRLLKVQMQLAKLRKEACLPGPDLRQVLCQTQDRLGVRKSLEIRVSNAITSPFVCGLLRPAILLPASMSQGLSPPELRAVLDHEVAHLCRHDLVWSVCWHWMKALYWFHPLVWHIPAAHSLACEQEADRIASDQVEERGLYAQSLAQLALRVLTLPPVESSLTLNGTSQIARRLQHLKRERVGPWKWGHSLAGFGLMGVLFLITAGCEFSKASRPDVKAAQPAAATEFKEVLVTVEDQDGKPIAGATIVPDGFRVKGIHAADAYHWGTNLLGGPVKALTDSQGKAYVKYPVMGIPEEKEFTGQLIFSVVHPEFSTVRLQEYSVDGTEKPIRLQRGITLEVSGYFGTARQPVMELVPNLSEEGMRSEAWQKNDNGVLACHKLSPGGHLVQLMGRLSSGEIVYSEGFAFDAERGQQYRFALEMKPGIRLEGRIDDKVPRPVTNGRVIISVRPKEFPAVLVPEDYGDLVKRFGYFHFWKSYRPLAPDGTFVFESVPPGEVDVLIHGDGFVSRNGGEPKNRINGQLKQGLVIGVPQAFPLTAPVTGVEVVTEPSATLEVTAKTQSGMPVEGATVYVNPNVMRMQTAFFGTVPRSNEEPFRKPASLPKVPYSAVTDKNGIAVIRNVPAINRGALLDHPQFQVPVQEPNGWRDRHIRCRFSPGETNRLALTLEPKGKEFIGSPR